MFKVYFTNHQYYSSQKFNNAFDALNHLKGTSLEGRVELDISNIEGLEHITPSIVVTHSPLNGTNWQGLSMLSQITKTYAACLLGLREQDLGDLKTISLAEAKIIWLQSR